MATNFIVLLLLSFLYLFIVALISLAFVNLKEDISYAKAYYITFVLLTVLLSFILYASCLLASNGILL